MINGTRYETQEVFTPQDGVDFTVSPAAEMITPAGNPVSGSVPAGFDPHSIPDGANEFTYSPATDGGILTITLKAKLTGIGGLGSAFHDKFKFEVDGVGGSKKTWDEANPDGKPTISGDFLEAKVRFTGLPANNSDLVRRTLNCYLMETCLPKTATKSFIRQLRQTIQEEIRITPIGSTTTG